MRPCSAAMSCSALAALAPTSAELRVSRLVASTSTFLRRTTCSLYSASRLSMSSRRARRLAMSACIFSPSPDDMQPDTDAAKTPSASDTSKSGRAPAVTVRPLCRSAPGEVDTSILRPARLIGSLGVQRSARQGRQLRPVGAEPSQVVAHRLRATLGQREVVLLRAARIGVARERRDAADLLETLDVARERGRRLGRERRLVEVEVDRLEAALAGRRRGRLVLGAEALDAVLVLRAVVLGLARLLRAAGPLDAVAARALLVALAGAALVGDALLVGGAVRLALAVARDGIALAGVARVARGTVGRGAALLALARHAELLGVAVVLAVLVGLARRVVGLAPRRDQPQCQQAQDHRRHVRGIQEQSLPVHGGPLVGPNRTFAVGDCQRASDGGRPFRSMIFQQIPT